MLNKSILGLCGELYSVAGPASIMNTCTHCLGHVLASHVTTRKSYFVDRNMHI